MSVRDNFDCPVYRQSVFIGVRRAAIDHIDFAQAFAAQRPVEIRCLFLGDYETIFGVVVNITRYADGRLIDIEPRVLCGPGAVPSSRRQFLKWRHIPLWVPDARTAQCGVLCVWPSNSEPHRLTEHLRLGGGDCCP